MRPEWEQSGNKNPKVVQECEQNATKNRQIRQKRQESGSKNPKVGPEWEESGNKYTKVGPEREQSWNKNTQSRTRMGQERKSGLEWEKRTKDQQSGNKNPKVRPEWEQNEQEHKSGTRMGTKWEQEPKSWNQTLCSSSGHTFGFWFPPLFPFWSRLSGSCSDFVTILPLLGLDLLGSSAGFA